MPLLPWKSFELRFLHFIKSIFCMLSWIFLYFVRFWEENKHIIRIIFTILKCCINRILELQYVITTTTHIITRNEAVWQCFFKFMIKFQAWHEIKAESVSARRILQCLMAEQKRAFEVRKFLFHFSNNKSYSVIRGNQHCAHDSICVC